MIRDNFKLTQTQFADRLDVYEQIVLCWENNSILPSKEQLEKIAETFEIPAHWRYWLLDGLKVTPINSKKIALGARIRTLRKKNVMTQEELAFEIGVDRRSVIAWEHGRFTPETSNLLKIAKLFNVSQAWLADGIGSEYDKFESESVKFNEQFVLTLLTTLPVESQIRLVERLDVLHREEMFV